MDTQYSFISADFLKDLFDAGRPDEGFGLAAVTLQVFVDGGSEFFDAIEVGVADALFG
jgi:hypothetical protein